MNFEDRKDKHGNDITVVSFGPVGRVVLTLFAIVCVLGGVISWFQP